MSWRVGEFASWRVYKAPGHQVPRVQENTASWLKKSSVCAKFAHTVVFLATVLFA